VERDAPLVTDEVGRANFTNEGGAFGTTRFLKNVMGLWILERCRAEWEAGGLPAEHDRLLAEVSALDTAPGLIYPDDPRFLNPPAMLAAIAEQMAETGQRAPARPAEVARVVLDSLALRYASVLRTIERLTGARIHGVRVVGGGSRNDYLNQATANAALLPVEAGPVEATVIGNVLVQAVRAGRFASLAEARAHVAERTEARRFEPHPGPDAAALERRYAEIEARYAERPAA
jgi:rhamnulokinase